MEKFIATFLLLALIAGVSATSDPRGMCYRIFSIYDCPAYGQILSLERARSIQQFINKVNRMGPMELCGVAGNIFHCLGMKWSEVADYCEDQELHDGRTFGDIAQKIGQLSNIGARICGDDFQDFSDFFFCALNEQFLEEIANSRCIARGVCENPEEILECFMNLMDAHTSCSDSVKQNVRDTLVEFYEKFAADECAHGPGGRWLF